MTIPIDFVAGTHGNFLEVCLNCASKATTLDFSPFGLLGTSHQKSNHYEKNKVFDAQHWSELYSDRLTQFPKIISIDFDADDLLLVSSLSILRAGDFNIDNNELSVNTFQKLNNKFYQSLLTEIYTSYPMLDKTAPDIPRYVLREFFKFGFKEPSKSGLWSKKSLMHYSKNSTVYVWKLKNFYSWDLFCQSIIEVGEKFNLKTEPNLLIDLYKKFLSQVPYLKNKIECDLIINQIVNRKNNSIPNLTLFQESYINGALEKIYNKEMPFQQETYFKNTEDVVYYIENWAPNI